MLKEAARKLSLFYRQFESRDRVLVAINADPDAVASAIAVKRLLWRKAANITICRINVVKRPDNIAMIRLLGAKIIHMDRVVAEDFTKFVMVDSQPSHNESFKKFSYDVIIDHHPDSSPDAAFVDIRPDYGATATILTEYIRTAGIKPSPKLATGLFYAVKTDTRNFESDFTSDDINAFHYLHQYTNVHLVRKIESSELQPGFLNFFAKAINERVLKRGHIFVHLGNVYNPDICVLVADFFMKIHNVRWSIVSGIYRKKLVVIFRNDGLGKDAGRLADSIFGKYGSAGGHASMARAEMNIRDIAKAGISTEQDEIKAWIIAAILGDA